MKRGRPLRRKAGLRMVSAKREAEHDERETVRARVMARDGGCVLRYLSTQRVDRLYLLIGHGDVAIPERDCAGRLDAHETAARGTHPGSHLVDDLVVTLCRSHHDWCHAHPIEARAMGLKERPST